MKCTLAKRSPLAQAEGDEGKDSARKMSYSCKLNP